MSTTDELIRKQRRSNIVCEKWTCNGNTSSPPSPWERHAQVASLTVTWPQTTHYPLYQTRQLRGIFNRGRTLLSCVCVCSCVRYPPVCIIHVNTLIFGARAVSLSADSQLRVVNAATSKTRNWGVRERERLTTTREPQPRPDLRYILSLYLSPLHNNTVVQRCLATPPTRNVWRCSVME